MTGNNKKDNNRPNDTAKDAKTKTELEDNEFDDEDFGDFESGGGSLLALVQPELPSLSQAWLAALKDHALLSLPPEFASQLPHDGGAFYMTETMDSCRPHYAASWPPLVHAAAIFLNATQFKGEAAQDRFHLLFGICMEALCSPRLVEPIESVITCLRALFTLLDSELPRQMLMTDRSLPIELSNVLHRLLLTRDSSEVHQLVMDVLSQVIKAATEDLDTRRKKKLKEVLPANQDPPLSLPEVDDLGEGGNDGVLVPGKSLVFAVLEVCLCLLVNQIPNLNPGGPLPPSMSLSSSSANGVGGVLVARALNTMGRLPNLCSPSGGVAILPTILYLTTGVLRETGCPTKPLSEVPGEVTGALQCLRAVASHPFSSHPEVVEQWRLLLQSTLAKIIDLAKTGGDNAVDEDKKLDEVAMMMCIAVFVLHSPPQVASAPNLQYPCINHLRQCLMSDNNNIKIKCIQTLRTIFGHCEARVCAGYVHALAPRLLDILHTKQSKAPVNESELSVTLESISACEALVQLAEPKHRGEMVKMLVPALVDCLLEGPALKEASKETRKLHESALSSIMKIGLNHPQEFKSIMAETGELRSRVETAIRSAQSSGQTTGRQNKPDQPSAQRLSPSIKLKTTFEHFT